MPQFDFTTYSSQIFWFLICFALLYFTMGFVILPRIREIFSTRKNVIDSDLTSANVLESQISDLQTKAENLRREASQKYQSQLDEVAKISAQQREKMLEELKEKLDSTAQKSRQELKNFVEKSRTQSEDAVQNLVQIIKNKIFNA